MTPLEAWAEIQRQWSSTATPIALNKNELKAYIIALKSSMDSNTTPPSIALSQAQVQQIKDLLNTPTSSSQSSGSTILGGTVNIGLKL